MQKKWIGLLLCCFSFFVPTLYAGSGFSIQTLVIDKDPDDLRGFRASYLYFPERWQWEHIRIFLDASYGSWHVPNPPNRQISIYSLAPVLRFIKNGNFFSPFIDLSIGPSYLSRTKIGCQKLGIHFAFQDQVSVGLAFGKAQHIYMSANIMHYSNGSISEHNSGITIPLLVTLGYRF